MFRIDNQSRQAVYEQIVQQVEKYVLSGILAGGDKMPSVRKLSIELNVNPNTVQRAYTELERSIVIVTAPGRGAFVSESGINVLKDVRRKQYISELERLVSQLKVSKVEKQEILTIVDQIYEGGGEDD
jgi:GntR family transcriptional regulator